MTLIHAGQKRRTEKHGYGLTAKRCSCDVCQAYLRGYAAGERARFGKRTAAKDYEDDEYMKELLP